MLTGETFKPKVKIAATQIGEWVGPFSKTWDHDARCKAIIAAEVKRNVDSCKKDCLSRENCDVIDFNENDNKCELYDCRRNIPEPTYDFIGHRGYCVKK